MTILHFASRNQKLNHLAAFLGYSNASVTAFDLPAGFTCQKANICKAFANRQSGKLIRGKNNRVLCYAAKMENYLPTVRESHWRNYDAILNCGDNRVDIAELIHTNLPKSTKVIRIHSSGDFFSPEYFWAWDLVAHWNPQIRFFGYTKHLEHVLSVKEDNFHLVYSYGGLDDSWRDELESQGLNVPTCYIDEYPGQHKDKNCPVVCGKGDEAGDFSLIMKDSSFRLAIH